MIVEPYSPLGGFQARNEQAVVGLAAIIAKANMI